MKYRPEIDGLRALAVLPVILFHAGIGAFSGGFIGVDIFFVISGYLITTIIIQDLDQGTFTLQDFYNRRIRRIFPALAGVLLICLPMAWIWLPANAMKDFCISLMSVITFSSNFFFWQQDGYFETAAELQPLLHTWSLAVEEQYYIIFPVVMMLLWRFGKKMLLIACIIGFFTSLGLAQWASHNAVRTGFYMLPTRGWELLIGAFCAYYLQWRVKVYGHHITHVGFQQSLSLLGLIMIGWAVFSFDKLTPTPSLITLVPVLGASLIILFANKGTWVQTALGYKPVVAIGLVSYSAYLWHQPVFVFYRYSSIIEPSAVTMIILSALSILIGFISWRFIEQPFRIKNFISRKTVYGLAGIFCVLMLTFSMLGYKSDGFASRTHMQLPENLQWASLGDKVNHVPEVCDLKIVQGMRYVMGCEFGDVHSNHVVVLYGDSHAEAIRDALDKTAQKNNIKIVQLDVYECENIPYMRQNADLATTDCDARYEEFLAYVQALSTDVILINRWTFRLYPLEGYDVTMPYKNSEGFKENDSYREYAVYEDSKFAYDPLTKEKYLKLFVEKLAQASKNLYLVYPIPEMAIDISRANILHRNKTGQILENLSIPYQDYLSRNEFVLSVFDNLQNDNIRRVKPSDIFCNTFAEGRCVAQFESVPYYYDDDHLSDLGAQMVLDKIFKGINIIEKDRQ